MVPANVYLRYDKVDEDIPLDEPNLIRVKKQIGTDYLVGFVNSYGQEVVPCEYIAHDYRFNCGLLSVTNQNNKVGYIDRNGDFIYYCQFDIVTEFKDNLCGVAKWEGSRKRFGLIDNRGNILIDFKYSFLAVMGQNRLIVEDSPYRGVGMLDYNGNEIVSLKYSQLGHILSDGTLEYSLPNGEHGMMDIYGNHLGVLAF